MSATASLALSVMPEVTRSRVARSLCCTFNLCLLFAVVRVHTNGWLPKNVASERPSCNSVLSIECSRAEQNTDHVLQATSDTEMRAICCHVWYGIFARAVTLACLSVVDKSRFLAMLDYLGIQASYQSFLSPDLIPTLCSINRINTSSVVVNLSGHCHHLLAPATALSSAASALK